MGVGSLTRCVIWNMCKKNCHFKASDDCVLFGVDPRVETHIRVAFVVAEGKVRGMR